MDRKRFQGKSPAWTGNGSIDMGYTPRHAKPGSVKDAATSGYASGAITAPSIGRHAAPENKAQREHRPQGVRRGGKKTERRRLSAAAGRAGAGAGSQR
jgi:hypothetical protein